MLLRELRKKTPAVDMNIFRSVENVNLQTIISYHSGDDYHHFLDSYSDGKSVHGTVADGSKVVDLKGRNRKV